MINGPTYKCHWLFTEWPNGMKHRYRMTNSPKERSRVKSHPRQCFGKNQEDTRSHDLGRSESCRMSGIRAKTFVGWEFFLWRSPLLRARFAAGFRFCFLWGGGVILVFYTKTQSWGNNRQISLKLHSMIWRKKLSTTADMHLITDLLTRVK